MRKLVASVFIIVLLIIGLAIFFQFYATVGQNTHKEENLTVPEVKFIKPTNKTIAKQKQNIIAVKKTPEKNSENKRKITIVNKIPIKTFTNQNKHTDVNNSWQNKGMQGEHKHENTFYHKMTIKGQTIPIEHSLENGSIPITTSTGDHHKHAYSIVIKTPTQQEEVPSTPVAPSTPIASNIPIVTSPPIISKSTSEALLKYVLFTVSYDTSMNAGETKSLQLRLSPRSILSNLQKAVQEKKIPQSQINVIEQVQSKFKYVTAELVAKNHCLTIEKKMPEEDKVYLPSSNESSADQVWQWDLTAPEQPTTTVCDLSLFIRLCLNQNDCIPSQNPDKEFNIFIQITLAHKILTWFTNLGNLASIGIPILTLIGLIAGWIWRKKSRKKELDKQ